MSWEQCELPDPPDPDEDLDFDPVDEEELPADIQEAFDHEHDLAREEYDAEDDFD
jgi:hypothetical protein